LDGGKRTTCSASNIKSPPPSCPIFHRVSFDRAWVEARPSPEPRPGAGAEGPAKERAHSQPPMLRKQRPPAKPRIEVKASVGFSATWTCSFRCPPGSSFWSLGPATSMTAPVALAFGFRSFSPRVAFRLFLCETTTDFGLTFLAQGRRRPFDRRRVLGVHVLGCGGLCVFFCLVFSLFVWFVICLKYWLIFMWVITIGVIVRFIWFKI